VEGQSDESAGVYARGNQVNYGSYSFDVAANGVLSFGISGSFVSINSDLRPTQEDVILQLDVVGDSITAWAWRAGEAKPTTPVFTRINDQLTAGFPGVYYGLSPSGTAIFRHVHVSDAPILDADFDGNGQVDGNDFVAWQRGLGSTGAAATLAGGDANGDNVVDAADLALWKSNFGSGGLSAVPEPTSVALSATGGAVLAFAILLGRRRF
jgi:hypothetical protein